MAVLEENSDSSVMHFENAVIPPGEQAVVKVRITIQPGTEKSLRFFVNFRTNELENTQRSIAIVAERENAIRSDPGEVVLGSLRPGEKISRTILLKAGDESSSPKIDRVQCSRTDLFHITRRDPTQAERDQSTEPGPLIAAFDITGIAPAVGAVEAKISVFEHGNSAASLIVPIVGVVRAPYSMSPSSVVFPNMTGKGPIYHLNCLCRRADGQMFQLEVGNAAGLSLALASPGLERNAHSFRVEWPANEVPAAGITASRTVQLIVRCGNSSENIALEVLCHRPEAP